jgi:hypothetical protein
MICKRQSKIVKHGQKNETKKYKIERDKQEKKERDRLGKKIETVGWKWKGRGEGR